MKKAYVTMVLGLATVMLSCAQSKEEKAPQEVLSVFNAQFPGITKVEWEKEHDDEWEGEFKQDGKEYTACFKADGTWMETEREIKKGDLPERVKTTLNEKYTSYKIEEVEWVESPAGNFYEMEIETGDQEFEISIDANGKIIKTESEEEDED